MRVLMSGATDKGRSRKTNQDSIYYDQILGVGIVADGIGGRKGGDVASSMAVSHIRNSFKGVNRLAHDDVRPFLVSSIDKSNLAIMARGEHDPKYSGMGTTLECLLFSNNRLYLGHVGDSRTYLYYRKNQWQLTLDHNVKNFLERGWLRAESLPANWKGSALVRALGLSPQLEIDVYHKEIRPDEIYITASDGLFDMVPDVEVSNLVRQYSDDIKNLPQALIDEANRKGGRDNITVLVSKVVENK